MRCVAFQVILRHVLICLFAHAATVAEMMLVKIGVSVLVVERYARMLGFMFTPSHSST